MLAKKKKKVPFYIDDYRKKKEDQIKIKYIEEKGKNVM